MRLPRRFIAISPSKVWTLAVLLAAILPLPAQAHPKFLEPAELVEKLRQQIAKQSIHKDFDLFNDDVLNGVSAAIKYKYRAEPSYMESYYTRYDSYYVEGNVNPAAWIEEIKAPFALGLNANTEIVFARQFKDQLDSVKAIPYTLLKLPVSAERAMKELNVGDFVSFQTHLGLVLSVGASVPATELFTASGSTHLEVHGDFMVHLFKTEPNKVRVKFIAIRGNEKGVNGNISAVNSTLKITGLKIVDKQITRRVELNPAEVAKSFDHNDLFMIDYVFDLSHPEVAEAYNHIMQEKMRFKLTQLLDPITNREDLEKDLVTDLTEVEDLYNEDKEKPEDEQRIQRVFKGSAAIESESSSFKFGLNIVRFEKNSYYAQNKILSADKDDNLARYVLDTFSLNGSVNFFLKLFDKEDHVNANLLFSADDNYNPKNLVALVLSRDRAATSLSTRALQDFKKALERTLPERIFREIEWKNWDYEFGEKVNVSMQHQISFNADCLRAAENLSKDEIKARVLSALHKLGIDPEEESNYNDEPNLSYQRDQINAIINNLNTSLDKSLEPTLRYQAFVKLKDTRLFIDTGAAILFSLLPEDRLEDLVNYKLILTGRKIDKLEFQFGRKERNALYDSIMYVQSVLNNRSIDLRIYKK